ncbi:DUF3307 domain-containing protein [Celeribacter naphthalenivorans]|uniref:DUF3307 domain-containing protein n=1 Tax=Celeribacter naphthalenivorans TaxID=1614694 RepID=UPI001CF943BF|nr:DUF3307 domain-containing protein [Celeribacter naphthalenivorans]
MAETLAALFLAHVLADYVFQPEWMVEEKSRPETLFLHALIVLLTAMATTGQVASPMIYALALIHIVIDTIKTRFFSDTFLPHISDQALHLTLLALIALIAPDLFTSGPYAALPWLPKAMLFTAGAIYTILAGGIAVEKLIAELQPAAKSKGYAQSGRIIGHLERSITFLGMLAGFPELVGFLFAAKAVMRFQTGKTNEKRYELIFIGTLASFGWAIAVTLAVLFIAAQLPPLGISALND